MRRARQPGTARTLIKRAFLCLLLGAALQHAVAVGFAWRGQASWRDTARWRIQADMHGWTCSMDMMRFRGVGCDVLSSTCSYGTRLPELPNHPTDWQMSQNLWIEVDPRTRQPVNDAGIRPPSWSRFAAIAQEPLPDDTLQSLWGGHSEWGCGWPWRSATCCFDGTLENTTAMHDAFALSTIPGTGAIRRFIPLRWYWPGALANASLYMVLLFLPLTITSWGVWKTRQHLRRRAGRCAACGYDLRGADHAVCPECGGA